MIVAGVEIAHASHAMRVDERQCEMCRSGLRSIHKHLELVTY